MVNSCIILHLWISHLSSAQRMRGGFSVSRRILVGCTHSWLYLLKVGFNGMLIIFDKLAVIEQSHFLVQFVLLCFKLSFQVSQWNKVIWFFHTKHYLFLFTFLLPVLFHLHCFGWQFFCRLRFGRMVLIQKLLPNRFDLVLCLIV